MRNTRSLRSLLVGLLVAAGALSVALAGGSVHPLQPHRAVPINATPLAHPSGAPIPMIRLTPPPITHPTPFPTATPFGGASSLSKYVGGVPRGTVVPLSKLPPLPMKSAMNTLAPNQRRILSADGQTITIVGTGGGCATAVGSSFPVGCTVYWQANNLLNGGDTYQDYQALSNQTTIAATGGTYNPPDSPNTTTMSTAGTYVFATYDVTTGQWAAVAYIAAGPVATLRVYQDPFHTTETYQYDANSSSAAYIDVKNTAANDLYVVDIEYTGQHPTCVFSAPVQSGGLPANTLCDPSQSAGETAPGGELSVTWPIAGNNYAAGTYSITIYDKTIGERIGQVQIAMTGTSGITMTLSQNTIGANAVATPSPAPVRTPGVATVFAWDSASEQSVSGITLGVGGLTNGNYLWSINDPDGIVIAQNAVGPISGVQSQSFSFSSMGISGPGTFPSQTFTASLFNKSTGSVFASQYFKLVGYADSTVFHTTSDVSSLSVPAGGSTTTTLKFTNSGDTIYGTGNGDALSAFAFTTGKDFLANTANGRGIEVALSGSTLAQCASVSGCSATATDTNGSVWVVHDFCSNAVPTTTSECYILLEPNSPGYAIPVGQSISVGSTTFYAATGVTCTTNCEGLTSILPEHGVEWSNDNTQYASFPVYFTTGAALTATAHISLDGASTPAGYFPVGGAAPIPEAHLYQSRFLQASYSGNSPDALSPPQNYSNILGFTIHNTSGTSITEFAFTQAGALVSQNALVYVAIDGQSQGGGSGWQIVTCPTQLSNAFVCVQGYGGRYIASGTTQTIYVDLEESPTAAPYADFTIEALKPVTFAISADNAAVSVPVNYPPLTVDSLAFAEYSLSAAGMSASFSPGTVGQGSSPTLGVVVTNTSLTSDPYPDYLDSVIIEMPNSYSLGSSPTVSTPGWSYLGQSSGGGVTDLWFGVCPSQYVAGDGPPNSPPIGLTYPLQNPYPALPQCSTAQEDNSLAPAGGAGNSTLNVSIPLQNFNSTGQVTFTMYAHGANVNGWSLGKQFSLEVTPVSAAVGFSEVGKYGAPQAVATNTVPLVGGNSNATYGNSFVYSVKNTSNTQNITSFRVRIPGTDVNGLNATDSSGNYWHVTGAVPALSGNVDGCTVTNALAAESATAGGADGEIDIGGASCALKPGDTIVLSFSAINPESQSDSYQFDTYCINNTSSGCNLNYSNTNNLTAGENWLGDSRIKVQLSIGLNMVVDPSNPGPGGSTPSVNCPSCAFSGQTVDVGTVGSNSTGKYTDVVLASVIIQSTTTVNWTLSVYSSNNPLTSGIGSPSNELQVEDDPSNSSSGAGINFDQNVFGVIPTNPGTPLQVAHGASITSRTTPYDILQNYSVTLGTENVQPQQATLTYTLIAN